MDSPRDSGWSPTAISQAAQTVGVILAGIVLVLVQQRGWLPSELSPFTFFLTPGWLLWLWTRLEAQFDEIYMLRMRTWAYLWNPTVSWSSQFVLSGIEDPGAFDQLGEWVVHQYSRPNAMLMSSTLDEMMLRLPYGVVRLERASNASLATDLTEYPDEPGAILRIDLPHMSSGYRGAIRTVQDDVIPLVQHATQVARPHSTTYVLQAQFPEGNPYFGLYIRRLGALRPDRIEFQISFSPNVPGSHRNVTVSRTALEVAADDLAGFQTLVHQYLAIR